MGLRVRVAASFVLVTVGAVLLVEAVLIGVVGPGLIHDKLTQTTSVQRVTATVQEIAAKLSSAVSAGGDLVNPASHLVSEEQKGAGSTVVVPLQRISGCIDKARTDSLLVLLAPDGTVLDSSYPGCFVPGQRAPALPGGTSGSGVATLRDRELAWAVAPVVRVPGASSQPGADPADLLRLPGAQEVATLYLHAPVVPVKGVLTFADVRPMVLPGLVVLAAAIPVGLLFGYVSMRRPVRRLRRLAVAARAIAGGELGRRVPVSGRDELAQLEADLNRMAEQLTMAMAAERELASAHARAAERARIARELHDSVSQELFSMRVLAGGIARALPAGSDLLPQIESLERATGTAATQMRALLLELRPVELSGTGLAGALDRLCRQYTQKLGIAASARAVEVGLPEPQAHGLLRIAQEAFANAAHHGQPRCISATLFQDDTGTVLTIRDDGHGFDPGAEHSGLGLELMRERAAELGGTLTVTSSPQGTVVEARLP